jgi:hypothetical protein
MHFSRLLVLFLGTVALARSQPSSATEFNTSPVQLDSLVVTGSPDPHSSLSERLLFV